MKNRWQQTTLKDLCVVDWGNTNLTKAAYVDGGEFLAVSAAGCDGRIGHKEHSKYTPVLSAIGAQCGKMFFPDEDFTAIKNTITLTPRDGKCCGRFLYYLLTFVELPKRGAGQPFISKGDIQSFPVAVPPLAEQRRIVGILDEAFEGFATVKANTEKNLRNARAICESYLQSVFTQRGAVWTDRRKPLVDLCELIVDCEHKTAPTQQDGIPSIRTPNIGKGKLLLDGVYRVSEKTYKAWTHRAEPRPGDLILAREAPAGNVAVIPANMRVCLGQRTVLIRPKPKVFESSFLAFLLLQPEMQQRLLAHSRGATVQHVNMKDIRALHVGAIPPLDLQRGLVSRLKSVADDSERLATLYERKLAALEALKKSLLHQAFTGELTTRPERLLEEAVG